MVEVPEGSLLTAIRSYAADVLGCLPERITVASRFDDGNRHAVYRVSYLDAGGRADNIVLRVSLSSDADELAQAEREATVLAAVGGRSAPSLRDVRQRSPWFDTPTIIMQFMSGRQLDLQTASLAEVEQVGLLVAWVHDQPVGDLTAVLSSTGDIASYVDDRHRAILSGLARVNDPVAAGVAARVQRAADIIDRSWHETWRDSACFRSAGPLALLHGDIAFGNILWDTQPVLVDWEYSRVGDPADEIAYLFDQNSLNTQRREAFWTGYRGSSSGTRSADVIERVAWWEPLTLLGSSLWWLERWIRRTNADAAGTIDITVEREPSYYVDNVHSRLDRLNALLA